ncbi:uncharacterized protein [Venturia canescens]|uniref:uncharacterized protein isoform X2 n=1 Tax=Venturia canescens TaxID=32260 RepID=UPI001C9CFAA4|nr:uncharacterized protein LOC122406409 isoform X2 [Venturia canescens]
MQRRVSLRDTLGNLSTKLKSEKSFIGKLRGRYFFRSIVRRVIEYSDWIGGDPIPEEIGDDVAVNVKMAQRGKKQEKKGLTMEDRSALLTKLSRRTKDEKTHILHLIKTLRAFRKYPDNLKQAVAAVCQYQYLGPGRVIVRQGHPAFSLYYIAKGDVLLTKTVTDSVTGDITEVKIGTMGPGDMFGEIALLHSIPRTTTVTTSVDLFYIAKIDFDRILKNILLRDWSILQDALVTFNYFKAWDESTIRECCILSKIKNFEPNEVLLGDGKGMVNYVYFILAGECRLIEHIIIQEEKSFDNVKFKLYEPDESSQTSIDRARGIIRNDKRETHHFIEVKDDKSTEGDDLSLDPAESKVLSKPAGRIDAERISTITTTLQDVVNQWHEITEVAAMLMREPSVSSQHQYPPGVRTVFMQICKFFRGACFGLGEEMRNRRIVSITPVRCLLVPRYWLLEHNRANIWERVKLFMESKYPTQEKLLKHFVTNRRWMSFKHLLVADILHNGRNVRNDTTIHDVPYSIRINEEIDEPAGKGKQAY